MNNKDDNTNHYLTIGVEGYLEQYHFCNLVWVIAMMAIWMEFNSSSLSNWH